MEILQKVQYMTSKGQITLPAAWRKRIKTNAVIVRQEKRGTLEISPAAFYEEAATGWVSIFDPKEKKPTANEILRFLRKTRNDKKVRNRK